jgi:hypothetical protein
MSINIVRHGFVLVASVAVGAAVFRVATAPDRIKERRDTAHAVCLSSGGKWVKVERDEMCVRSDSGGTF